VVDAAMVKAGRTEEAGRERSVNGKQRNGV
jgi:hypothetical protein